MADLKDTDKHSWPNNCRRCNEDATAAGSTLAHGSCCLACRNFDSIDAKARASALDTILNKGTKDVTFAQYFKNATLDLNEFKDRLTKAQQERDEALAPCNKAISDYNRDINDASKPPEYKDALTKTKDSAKERYENALESVKTCQNAIDACRKKAETDVMKLANALVQKSGIETNGYDPIVRARFFFTWIATSIKYDKTVIPVEEPITTLAGGIQVCRGFAKLFNQMFNATQPNIEGKSRPSLYISGWARQGNETQATEANRHAWNAFPYEENGKLVYKLIDSTWGAGNVNDAAKSTPLDASWFTRSNDSFNRDHFPDGETTEVPEEYAKWSAKEKERFAQFTSSALDKSQFYGQQLPALYGSQEAYHIDVRTLVPKYSPIEWKTQAFQYTKACPHFPRESMPRLAFWPCNKGDKTIKDSDLQWPIVQLSSSKTDADRWTMAIDLAGTFKNCNQVVLLQDAGENYKYVAIWEKKR